MIIVFDQECNGLPKNYNAPATDLNNWPRILQLAFATYQDDGTLIEEKSYLVKPEGFQINIEAAKIHGLHEGILKYGISIKDALILFSIRMRKADVMVAHNVSFDENIIGAEMIRCGMRDFYEIMKEKQKYCTMDNTIKFCDIPGPYGPKWPRLQELHHKLFNTGFEGAHDAGKDVEITGKCYFELKRHGIIK